MTPSRATRRHLLQRPDDLDRVRTDDEPRGPKPKPVHRRSRAREPPAGPAARDAGGRPPSGRSVRSGNRREAVAAPPFPDGRRKVPAIMLRR